MIKMRLSRTEHLAQGDGPLGPFVIKNLKDLKSLKNCLFKKVFLTQRVTSLFLNSSPGTSGGSRGGNHLFDLISRQRLLRGRSGTGAGSPLL